MLSETSTQNALEEGSVSASGKSTVNAIISLTVEIFANMRTVREFDDESVLDPTLKPIFNRNHEPSQQATADTSATASPRSSSGAESVEGPEDPIDQAEKRIEALEKELAELRIAKDDVEHRLQSEISRTTIAEMRVESLEGNLQESRDRVAQLEKRHTKDV